MRSKQKIQYSKLWPIITGTIFVLCLIFCFVSDLSTMYDASLLVSIVTLTGGIFGSSIIWYSKKAAQENVYKLRMGMYKEATKQRLHYNEQMMKLKKKYELTDEDIYKIDESGDADEFMSTALSSAIDSLDSAQSENDAPNQIESF